jgi:hypothetical protein
MTLRGNSGYAGMMKQSHFQANIEIAPLRLHAKTARSGMRSGRQGCHIRCQWENAETKTDE